MNDMNNKRTQYSLVGLKEYLQEKYGIKAIGTPITDQDVYGYVQRGKLPDSLGGDKIKQGKQLVKKGQKVYYLIPEKKK
jgi:hypothetical protein